MTVNRSGLSLALSIVSIVAVVSFGIYYMTRSERTAFVNTSALFNEFKMKKSLEAEFKKVENMRKSQLDSMVVVLKVLNRSAVSKAEKELLEYKKEEFARRRDEFTEANEALTQKYNEQIWNQLNQYIKDYGDHAGIDYIYGATGDGTLMYAAEKKDITKEMINYANGKYEGLH